MKRNRIIVLLTDFGVDSPYVAQMKGVILQINPNVQIIDLTHSVHHQNITEASFIIKTSYQYFPKGSIFIAVVDPGVGTKRRLVCLTTDKYVFLAPDNGLLSGILKDNPKSKIYEITNRRYWLPGLSRTFHGRDILAPVAGYLSRGLPPPKVGRVIPDIKRHEIPIPQKKSNNIIGQIIFIDRFGNLITNMTRDILGRCDKLSVWLKNRKFFIDLSDTYADKDVGEVVALFGSSGYLEIAINQSNAHDVLRVKLGDKILVGVR